MTHEEHAEAVHKTMKGIERAVRKHHAALAAYVAEYGASAGIGGEIVALAVLPKDPPPNPE